MTMDRRAWRICTHLMCIGHKEVSVFISSQIHVIMVRFSAARVMKDWVTHCEQQFWACKPVYMPGHSPHAWVIRSPGTYVPWLVMEKFLPHCHMMTMDRPAGIERALGGSIAIQYRDATLRNRIAGNMHATFRWKPLTGALALECLDMNSHLHAVGDQNWGSAEWSSVQHERSVLARPEPK